MELIQFEIQLLEASSSHNCFKVQPVDVPTSPLCVCAVWLAVFEHQSCQAQSVI